MSSVKAIPALTWTVQNKSLPSSDSHSHLLDQQLFWSTPQTEPNNKGKGNKLNNHKQRMPVPFVSKNDRITSKQKRTSEYVLYFSKLKDASTFKFNKLCTSKLHTLLAFLLPNYLMLKGTSKFSCFISVTLLNTSFLFVP